MIQVAEDKLIYIYSLVVENVKKKQQHTGF